MRIDSHQHFWRYSPEEHAWIGPEMSALARDFLPKDLKPLLEESGFDGCIAVQAAASIQENTFLLELARKHAFIRAVVGWIDFEAADFKVLLKQYLQEPVMRGFRQFVEQEADPDYLIRDSFLQGIAMLTAHGYTYDLLIRPRHYASTLACVAQNPNQQFVLDHMAKPAIKSGEFTAWADFIEQLSSFPNVACKLSGYATEADWKAWKPQDFEAYFRQVIGSFGKQRILYGTDWPVSTLAASYPQLKELIAPSIQDFTADEREAFYGGNACRLYKIKI